MVTTPASFKKDSLHLRTDGGATYFISDNYFYKSEAYYRIVQLEVEGKHAVPSSKEVIEAFIVPVCLEKARMQGIPVCAWEVSYSYVSLPCIAYGIHYYSDPAEYGILRETEVAHEVIGHITNHGKYPFCYQPISKSAEVFSIVAIFGRTTAEQLELKDLARAVYATFHIPFLSMTVVWDGQSFVLSSLSNAKYSKLSRQDRALLRSNLGDSTDE